MTPRQALSSAPYALKAGCFPGDRITCFTPGGNPSSGCSTGTRCCDAEGTGFGPCLGEVTPNCNGNCVNFQTDVSNCGTCGNACPVGPNSSRACSSGACSLTCSAGYSNCDGNANNGCEVITATDVNNCGQCGNACGTAPNALVACNSGTCLIASCSSGFGNCDYIFQNGCETDLTSVTNCGTCGRSCSVSNGTASCNAGACGIASCNAGFANCDGSAANGCETNTSSSVTHCGKCGNACAGGQTCVSSSCVTPP